MRLNIFQKRPGITHEGAQAHPLNAEQKLRRSVLSCMLWEDEFYEDGQSIAFARRHRGHAVEGAHGLVESLQLGRKFPQLLRAIV